MLPGRHDGKGTLPSSGILVDLPLNQDSAKHTTRPRCSGRHKVGNLCCREGRAEGRAPAHFCCTAGCTAWPTKCSPARLSPSRPDYPSPADPPGSARRLRVGRALQTTAPSLPPFTRHLHKTPRLQAARCPAPSAAAAAALLVPPGMLPRGRVRRGAAGWPEGDVLEEEAADAAGQLDAERRRQCRSVRCSSHAAAGKARAASRGRTRRWPGHEQPTTCLSCPTNENSVTS